MIVTESARDQRLLAGLDLSASLEEEQVSPNVHHFMSSSQKHVVHVHEFLLDQETDPAKKVLSFDATH
jgi:hypothetical protein